MPRRTLRIAARTLLCAGALALGAALAWSTPRTTPPRAPEEALLPPAPVVEAAPIVVERAPEPQDVQPPEPVAEDAPDPFATSLRDGMVISGATSHRLILFSFDDGPDHRYTPGLLDTLDALDVKAVFFLTTRRFEGNTPRERVLADIARDIVRRGHVVGSHTMDHVQLPLLHGPELVEQIVGTEEVFERVLGQRPWLVRPPGGSRSPRIDAYLASRGYTQLLWNIGTGDYQVRTSEDVLHTFRRVLERRERENGERGGVVLLHDIHRWSVDALPQIVRWLEERNCELHADGEELYDVVGDPRLFFVPRADTPASEIAPMIEPDPEWLAARQSRLRDRAQVRCQQLALR